MWTSTSMSIGEAFIASAMGFSIVFSVLAFLAIVILIFAKLSSGVSKVGGKPAVQTAPAAPVQKDESETVAIITSVICEELRADPNELVIKGIREL